MSLAVGSTSGTHRAASRRRIDLLTVRVLRHAIDPGYQLARAGEDLAHIATGRLQLLAVRRRVQAALDERWSEVGARARDAIDHALALIAGGGLDPTARSSRLHLVPKE